LGVVRYVWGQMGWVLASLRRPHLVSEGFKNFGQGGVGQIVVVARWGGGRGAQVASGAGVLSSGVMGGCAAWLFAVSKWVGCRWWEVGPELDDPILPVIGQIECGQVARGIVGFIVMIRGRVPHCGLSPDRRLAESIWCPEGGVGWGGVVEQPLHRGEADHCFWWVGWGMCLGE